MPFKIILKLCARLAQILLYICNLETKTILTHKQILLLWQELIVLVFSLREVMLRG